MRSRSPTKGVVLLDALIAFAIAMLATTLILVSLPNSSARQDVRLDQYLAEEFAYSVLEEYRVTFPTMPTEGVDPSGWMWSIQETAVQAEPSNLSIPIDLFDVTLQAWHREDPDSRAMITTKIARPRG